jgi:protease-4
VWTGAQALEHGLVDALGDFQRAVEIAMTEAGLPVGGRVELVTVEQPKRWLTPAPAAAQALLGGQRAQQFADLASFMVDGELSALLEREQVWLLAPYLPRG